MRFSNARYIRKDTMKLAINAIYETLEKKRDLISNGIDVEKSYELVP